ncbi:MAG: hypothetical protein KDB90_04770 [Planctomycetes bacterium]|nr:hypothetical protein [Planctomycetota bacterium]
MALFFAASVYGLVTSVVLWTLALFQVTPSPATQSIRQLALLPTLPVAMAAILFSTIVGIAKHGWWWGRFSVFEDLAALKKRTFTVLVAAPCLLGSASWIFAMAVIMVYSGGPELSGARYVTTNRDGVVLQEVPQWIGVSFRWISLAAGAALASFACTIGLGSAARLERDTGATDVSGGARK